MKCSYGYSTAEEVLDADDAQLDALWEHSDKCEEHAQLLNKLYAIGGRALNGIFEIYDEADDLVADIERRLEAGAAACSRTHRIRLVQAFAATAVAILEAKFVSVRRWWSRRGYDVGLAFFSTMLLVFSVLLITTKKEAPNDVSYSVPKQLLGPSMSHTMEAPGATSGQPMGAVASLTSPSSGKFAGKTFGQRSADTHLKREGGTIAPDRESTKSAIRSDPFRRPGIFEEIKGSYLDASLRSTSGSSSPRTFGSSEGSTPGGKTSGSTSHIVIRSRDLGESDGLANEVKQIELSSDSVKVGVPKSLYDTQSDAGVKCTLVTKIGGFKPSPIDDWHTCSWVVKPQDIDQIFITEETGNGVAIVCDVHGEITGRKTIKVEPGRSDVRPVAIAGKSPSMPW